MCVYVCVRADGRLARLVRHPDEGPRWPPPVFNDNDTARPAANRWRRSARGAGPAPAAGARTDARRKAGRPREHHRGGGERKNEAAVERGGGTGGNGNRLGEVEIEAVEQPKTGKSNETIQDGKWGSGTIQNILRRSWRTTGVVGEENRAIATRMGNESATRIGNERMG